jgi:hypothetical protein
LVDFNGSASELPRRYATVAAKEKLRSDMIVITVEAKHRLKALRRLDTGRLLRE